MPARGVLRLIVVLLMFIEKGLPKGRRGWREKEFELAIWLWNLAGLLDTVGNLFYILASRMGGLMRQR